MVLAGRLGLAVVVGDGLLEENRTHLDHRDLPDRFGGLYCKVYCTAQEARRGMGQILSQH